MAISNHHFYDHSPCFSHQETRRSGGPAPIPDRGQKAGPTIQAGSSMYRPCSPAIQAICGYLFPARCSSRVLALAPGVEHLSLCCSALSSTPRDGEPAEGGICWIHPSLGRIHQVPDSQEPRYFSCSEVSVSICTPIACSFRRAIFLSICVGIVYTRGDRSAACASIYSQPSA
jgi:hypothetical protein